MIYNLYQLTFLIYILTSLSITSTRANKIKWFAYCYFEIDTSLVIDTLSCGKCIDVFNDEAESAPLVDNDSRPRVRRHVFANQTTTTMNSTDSGEYGSNSTSTSSLPLMLNSSLHVSNLKKSVQLSSEDFCSYFESHPNLHKREHEIKHIEQTDIYVIPLIPVLTLDWYHLDLLYLIEKNEIVTNLDHTNLTQLSHLADRLRTVELVNFGIESINHNAFRKFPNLKVLRLGKNNLNSVELSSFLTNYDYDDSSAASSSSVETTLDDDDKHDSHKWSKLIELDLSFNRLASIRLENFAYLHHLRTLNLSDNMLRQFDLHFLSVVTPHLQVLDLSNNQIKQLQLVDNHVHFTTSGVSLVSNLILNELVYLNLDRNYLSRLDVLFALNMNLINDSRFCNNMTNTAAAAPTSTRRPLLDLKINNNKWKCDCRAYELVESIIRALAAEYDAAGTTKRHKSSNESCYLTHLIRENYFMFINLADFRQHLYCFNRKASYLWTYWYRNNCLKSGTDEMIEWVKNSTNSSKLQMDDQSTITVRITPFFSATGSTTSQSRFFTTNRDGPFLKYDLSTVLYWISCICIAVITISCLLVAWFFCWKKRNQTELAAASMPNRNLRSSQSNHPTNANNNNGRSPAAGRNVYLFNSRHGNNTNANNNNNNTNNPYFYQLPFFGSNPDTNATSTQRNIANRTRPNETTLPNLYYISLNRNSNGVYIEQSTSANPGLGYANVAYVNGRADSLDEPPNYYEAILVKNNPLSKNHNLNIRNSQPEQSPTNVSMDANSEPSQPETLRRSSSDSSVLRLRTNGEVSINPSSNGDEDNNNRRGNGSRDAAGGGEFTTDSLSDDRTSQISNSFPLSLIRSIDDNDDDELYLPESYSPNTAVNTNNRRQSTDV